MTRISPNFKAKDFAVGTIKTGINGEKWIITININGLRKWSRVTKKIIIKKPKNITKKYGLFIKKRYNIPKKDAKFAVVTYLDFYKQNYSRFLKYFKTLEEANNFAYSKALKEFTPEYGESINFFGNKKLAKKEAIYGLPEYVDETPDTKPYKNKIISYIVNSTIYSVVKPYPGIENEWQDERSPALTYYPDAYYPSNKSFPIYVDDGSLREIGKLFYKNAKTGEVVQIPIPKKFL
jgi:hypothetical protein